MSSSLWVLHVPRQTHSRVAINCNESEFIMSKTFSTNMSFDLIEYIADIPSPEIAAQAMQSVAFRIDVLIQSNTRAVFKQLRKEEQDKLSAAENTADRRAEIDAAFAEVAAADQAFHDAGMDRSSLTKNVKDLVAIREIVIEHAKTLTALTRDWKGDPYKFEADDLEDLFHRRPDMKVSTEEKERMYLTAKMMRDIGQIAGDMPVEKLVAADIERRKTELDRMADTLVSQAPIVANFFQLIMASSVEATTSFWLMDLGIQSMLIDAARKAVEREVDRAKSNRKLSSLEFMNVLSVGAQTMKKLDEVLRSPKFVQRQIEDSVVEK